MSAFVYVKFISHLKRFGLFTGEYIPGPDPDAADKPASVTPECLGTYGGTVCTEHEALYDKAMFRMATGELPRDVPVQRDDDSDSDTDEPYVT